jgi:tetratricopeptide (TPR) repeat protein
MALVNLGNTYFGQGDYDTAVDYYRRAIAVRPKDASIHHNLGAAYSNKNDYAQAADAYRQAVTIDPNFGDAHYGLACSLYMLEQYDLAWSHVNTARRLGTSVPDEQIRAMQNKVR